MSCLLMFSLFMTITAEAVDVEPVIEHPFLQGVLVLGGIVMLAIVGASRGKRSRIPPHGNRGADEGDEAKNQVDLG